MYIEERKHDRARADSHPCRTCYETKHRTKKSSIYFQSVNQRVSATATYINMEPESTPKPKKQALSTPTRKGISTSLAKSNKQEKRQGGDALNVETMFDNDDADQESPDDDYSPLRKSALRSGRRHVSSGSISRLRNRGMANREHVDNSSDSEADEISRQERFFESAFRKFDPNGDDQVRVIFQSHWNERISKLTTNIDLSVRFSCLFRRFAGLFTTFIASYS